MEEIMIEVPDELTLEVSELTKKRVMSRLFTSKSLHIYILAQLSCTISST